MSTGTVTGPGGTAALDRVVGEVWEDACGTETDLGGEVPLSGVG